MRQVVILTGLLAVALVGSYTTWTADDAETVKAGEVLVYNAGKDDLQKIVWDGKKGRVELERRSDAAGDYLWIVSTERKEVPVKAPEPSTEGAGDNPPPEAADAEDDAPAEPAAPETELVETTSQYLGNTSADEVWTSFSPLKALRELGPVSGKDLSVLGFDEPTATMTVVRRSGPLELTVGGETYGSKDRYVRVGDKLYLVDDAALRPLEFANARLLERALHPLAEKDVGSVSVQTPDGKTLVGTQQNADDRAKAYWAREGTPDATDEVLGTWLGKLWRLRIQSYADPSEVGAALEPVFAYTVTGDGTSWTVEIVRETGDTGKEEYYARSTYNRSLAKLTRSLAGDAAADVPTLFTE